MLICRTLLRLPIKHTHAKTVATAGKIPSLRSSPHDLRRTCGTDLFKAGMRQLQVILGHESMKHHGASMTPRPTVVKRHGFNPGDSGIRGVKRRR
ncbi:tyrosine-type recombinase/integrase [Vreelandella rituensis]|uniref:Site-specific integrase n=1 Tax=Vreelandella rituensis TaxID=2282306 RepID=A0A368TVL2_9GAMM|nr:site-specific integrase [Halomonas rituensis]